MGITVCGINTPVLETVTLESGAPGNVFLEGGNYLPSGSTVTAQAVCEGGSLISVSERFVDPDKPGYQDCAWSVSRTGFVNGGFIKWWATHVTNTAVSCVQADFGDDAYTYGHVNDMPAIPRADQGHPGYDEHIEYYQAAIKTIYPDYPHSPSYCIVLAYHEIRYRSDGTIYTEGYNWTGNGVRINCAQWERIFGRPEDIEEIPDEEDDPEEDPSKTGGYGGTHDDSSDPVGLPTDPAIGVTNAGFINVYNPTVNGLRGLGDEIFPSPQNATDIIDAVVKLCQQFAYSRLIDYIIDCHVIPCAPTIGGSQPIKVGFINTTISAPVVTSDYVNVSCGSLSLAEFFGNFADYSLTTAKLWLPFVGFVDVKPEFWQAGTISVDYKFNIIDGSFMAYVRSTSSKSKLSGSVIASYGGNACMHFPITGVNYSNMASGLIGAATTMASGGNGAVGKGAFTALEAFSRGGDTQQSNGYNSTSAILGIRTPYLIIERVSPSWSALYQHDKGIPSNVAVQLQLVSGYTEIEDIDLTGIPLTKTETDELKQLLTEGVYF